MATTKQIHVSNDAIRREARSLTTLHDEDEASRILSDLSTLNSTTFTDISEATDAYLAFVMRVLGVRSATINKVDSHFMYVINARDDGGCGIPSDGVTPLEETFCQYVRAGGIPVVVTDAAQDARVRNIATRTDYNIGSYLGVPLIFSDGIVHGTLCALDPQPRQFTQMQIAIMRIVARHLALLIESISFGTGNNDASTNVGEVTSEVLTEQLTTLETVAHDLRNPLSGIQSYVDLFLHDMLGPVSEDQRGVLTQMARATRFMNRLINDLLDSAAETGAVAILSDAFDPRQLARSVVDSFQDQAAMNGLALHISSPSNIPMIIADPDRLRQILSNFVSNAIRYTLEGQITLHITADNDSIQFSVEDTGPGIPQTAQATIWHKHIRLRNEGPGIGLGLYIVQRLADAMHGTVGVQSELGKGSTFWVRLPVQGPPPYKFKWDVDQQ